MGLVATYAATHRVDWFAVAFGPILWIGSAVLAGWIADFKGRRFWIYYFGLVNGRQAALA